MIYVQMILQAGRFPACFYAVPLLQSCSILQVLLSCCFTHKNTAVVFCLQRHLYLYHLYIVKRIFAIRFATRLYTE